MISALRVWIWAIPAIMLGASSQAIVIFFSDLTDTPIATINGIPVSATTPGVTDYTAVGESISFTTSLTQAVSSSDISIVVGLTEPGSSTVSDRLRVTFHNNSNI